MSELYSKDKKDIMQSRIKMYEENVVDLETDSTYSVVSNGFQKTVFNVVNIEIVNRID